MESLRHLTNELQSCALSTGYVWYSTKSLALNRVYAYKIAMYMVFLKSNQTNQYGQIANHINSDIPPNCPHLLP